MKAMIVLMLKNPASMILGPKMILWGLRLATTLSSNKIDDNCVGIIEAAYENDVEKLKKSAEALVDIYNKGK